MYKNRFSSIGIVCFVLLCGLPSLLLAQKPSKQSDMYTLASNADKNVLLVNNYLDALARGDMNKARSYLASDYVEYGPAASDSMGLDQTLRNWETALNQRSEQAFNQRQLLGVKAKSGPDKGDWVLGRGVYHWKVPNTGTQIDIPFQLTAQINGDKMQKAYLYYDQADVLEKLGYQIIPPGIDPDAYLIRQVIEAETSAWLLNDGAKMGSFWADLPYAAHTVTDEQGKAYVISATELGELVSRLSTQKPNQPGTVFTNTHYNIRPNGNAAWASFEQTFRYPDGRTSTNLESRYLEKIDGTWKISHMTSIPKR
jgi:hypothetical protein